MLFLLCLPANASIKALSVHSILGMKSIVSSIAFFCDETKKDKVIPCEQFLAIEEEKDIYQLTRKYIYYLREIYLQECNCMKTLVRIKRSGLRDWQWSNPDSLRYILDKKLVDYVSYYYPQKNNRLKIFVLARSSS